MKRLEGKVALITGGAAGLGRSVAQRLAAEGASVIITDVRRQAGETTAQELKCTFLEQDVSDEARWIEVISTIEQRFARLDILVNNAGVLGSMETADPEEATLASWREIFKVNVEGLFMGCRAAIPAMRRAGGGSIINMSSIAGLRASPQAAAYGASKAAVRQFTKSVARYCAEQRLNVRCNSVHPGDIRTPLWEKAADEAARKRGIPVDDYIALEQADCPLGTFAAPEDVAAAVAYLASDDARHVTGTKLIVDGGTTNCEGFKASSSTGHD